MKFEQFLEANVNDKFGYVIEEKDDEKEEKKSDGDTVCMQSSLFMRILELVREDVDDDEVLHHLAEKIIEMSKDADEPLSMDDYKEIKKVVDDEDDDDEDDEDDHTEDQEDEDLDESKKCEECEENIEECDKKENVEECDEKNKKETINESLSARRRKGLVAKLVGKNLSKIRNRKRADLK